MNGPHAPLTTIERYFAALSAGDREGWLDCFVPEGGLEDPAGTPPRWGAPASRPTTARWPAYWPT